jgi:hypothetical protein
VNGYEISIGDIEQQLPGEDDLLDSYGLPQKFCNTTTEVKALEKVAVITHVF